ncbi:MAG: FtsX-like permease family protein [Bryobacterales bacterium]|nr:FtsX-like permease family protein [Bryobacterales bacterium]
MRHAQLLYRLIVRPLLREKARTTLTVLAVALGVSVVVAIDLAGEASTNSFRSSIETLQGSASYEIHQVGGIPEAVFGELVRMPGPLRFSARIEGFGTVLGRGERVPVFGVDLIGDALLSERGDLPAPALSDIMDSDAVWVTPSLGVAEGEEVQLLVNDRTETFTVGGVIDTSQADGGPVGAMVVMDLSEAQRALDRVGRLDRIYVHEPDGEERDRSEAIRQHLPPGAVLSAAGVRSQQSRAMLRAFRWNVRVLSYIALIVGAFLIYNTVSVSVVRRRPQIGVVRALGASRSMVRVAFLAEGCLLGAAGAALGLPLGRALAIGAVETMGRTVQALYVSSAPGEIGIRPLTGALAACVGIGIALAASWWPAREAAGATPSEAMARARLEYDAATTRGKWAWRALGCAIVSAGLCLLPAWERIPFAGYVGALGLVASAAMLTPRVSAACLKASERLFTLPFGVAGMLGARSLAASLARTSVIVAAMSIATAMMISVGIMVGSFRETVDLWIQEELRADLYLRPEGVEGSNDRATLSPAVVTKVEGSRHVAAVDRFRTYDISYGGLPATLASRDIRLHAARSTTRFLEGPEPDTIWDQLATSDSLIVSEPFNRKHDVHVGDTIELRLGSNRVGFTVAAVNYSYAREEGLLMCDRSILQRYIPDSRPSSIAIYLKPGADIVQAQEEIARSVAMHNVQIVRNREVRERSLVVFDRTFAIAYALEAVAIVVAILGMAGALLTLVLDRRAELGVLRVLGATKAQVRSLVLAQSGMLGLVSNLIGCLLGGALSLVLIKVINKQSFGWTIQFHWPVGFLLAALTAVYGASLVAGVYPARIAAARDPIEVLHEE